MTIKNNLLGGTDWADGNILYANDQNDTFNETIQNSPYYAPVGSVMAWLKNYTNTPTLPIGWVECNGQTLSDVDSVYNGQVIPNLNGDNRFLRGNSTSGTTGGATTHTHTVTTGAASSTLNYAVSGSGLIISPSSHTHSGTTANNNVSTEPPYMNVVWIMRVK